MPTPILIKPILTPGEFQAIIRDLSRADPHSDCTNAAWAVLVRGVRQCVAAQVFEISPGALWNAIRRIKHHARYIP